VQPSVEAQSEEAIVLAQAKPFRLGAVDVRPASREIVGPQGREMLEPRVMQVLVRLARAGGEVVTRDQLVEACWDRRFVGEDAVNRVSRSTSHDKLPLMTITINKLLERHEQPVAGLLKQLSNHEIRLYAKYSASAGNPVSPKFLRALYFPSGAATAVEVMIWSILGFFIRTFKIRRG
jgi:hypothetical protein